MYNPQGQPFNLYAARASFDDGPNTPTFHFPFGAAIAAHGYFVVFPDSYTGMLNAGGYLRLTFAGTVIDQANIPTLPADDTYARIPDGSTNWQITNNPSIDATNIAPTPVTSTTPVTTNSTGSSGSGSSSTTRTTPRLVTGKQPGWGKLQLPAADATAAPASNSPLVTSPVASPTSSARDMTRRILLTVLVVAFALSLFWCWKVFSSG